MDTKDAGRLGGLQRAKNLTPAQRSAAARHAIAARWAKARRKHYAATPRTRTGKTT